MSLLRYGYFSKNRGKIPPYRLFGVGSIIQNSLKVLCFKGFSLRLASIILIFLMFLSKQFLWYRKALLRVFLLTCFSWIPLVISLVLLFCKFSALLLIDLLHIQRAYQSLPLSFILQYSISSNQQGKWCSGLQPLHLA